MVHIIERGTPPGDEPIETKCRRCTTKFSFTEGEAKRIPDQRDGDYLEIACPVCSASVTVAC